MATANRRKKISRKNIILAVFFWLALIVFINIIPPKSIYSFTLFYLLFSLSLFATFKLFSNKATSFFHTLIVITYLLMRQYKVDNIINIILLVGILVTIEKYFSKV